MNKLKQYILIKYRSKKGLLYQFCNFCVVSVDSILAFYKIPNPYHNNEQNNNHKKDSESNPLRKDFAQIIKSNTKNTQND